MTSNDQQQDNKRKRPDASQTRSNVSQSLSQWSISKENGANTKKKKKEHVASPKNMSRKGRKEKKTKKKNEENPDQSFKPHFLKVSDRVFKQILSNAIKGGHQLVQCLNTEEKIQFIRHMTELTNQAQYLDLQSHLWQDYFDIGVKEGQWGPSVSNSFARQHRVCRTYGHPRSVVEKRLETIQYELQRTRSELQVCTEKLEQYAKQWQPFFNANDLSQAIIECVKNSQRRLCQLFELKRKVLQFDADDHQFIRAFYQYEPSREQIALAQKIWQATSEELKLKEQEEVLRKRIYIQRLPNDMDRMINRSVNQIQQSLSHPVLNNDRRASMISTCSKTVTQYKFDLMTIDLETIQMTQRDQREILVALQNELLATMPSETLQQLIVNRRENIIQRHEIQLRHKLKTFFDEAPMANEN